MASRVFRHSLRNIVQPVTPIECAPAKIDVLEPERETTLVEPISIGAKSNGLPCVSPQPPEHSTAGNPDRVRAGKNRRPRTRAGKNLRRNRPVPATPPSAPSGMLPPVVPPESANCNSIAHTDTGGWPDSPARSG